ncbi:cytochrome c oxidase subunit 7A-related protein, mitochondrial-like [Drosophila miranda]|uniref:cytochrome c oxidase subunit 7A-related protein, mitochondrial n=1 Tax=Drosophila miranda TaxID=7229 RepID=UPI00143F8245|nr:cytochrome c oxidase subunit 7A-related protein, mitochondrial [Drosophila miranda]XP_033244982.1 cytochrome c oxidase subunit 7A-related protein, mitochondrial-like [Drosophila miranda]
MQRNLLLSLRPLLRRSQVLSPLHATPWLVATPQVFATPRLFQTGSLMQAQKKIKGKLSPKIAKLQRQFQENNGKPVFLKGGPMDNILYRLTWVLAFIGILGDVWLWLGYIIYN